METLTEKVLAQLEETSDKFWNVSKDSANFLNMLIRIHKSQEVLELGTSNGYSGIWLARALEETGGHLTTIEYWDKRRDLALENFKLCGVEDRITSLLGSASDVIKEKLSDKQFDFVFMDASKPHYLEFFELLHPLLKSGGIIAADNITSHAEKVKPFVDEISSRKDYQVQILPLPDGMLIARKI
ncbi:O-methyltransferase [bacterium]|nr:O-methyltransferase [bacterium]